jgi:transposase
MHNGGFSHRRVADHFRVNHTIIVRLMQRFRQTGNVTFYGLSRSHSLMVEASDYSVCANVASKR